MNALVSIIVPVYKVEPFLNQCMESIVSQTYRNTEIILVDDGSHDSCPAMCDEWAEKDARIRVIHQKNMGLPMARNIGIANATGEYLAFVDSDDYVDCHMLEYSMNAFEKSKADIVVFDVNRVTQDGQFLESTEDIVEVVLSREEALESLFSAKIHDYAVNKVYKKAVFDSISFPKGYHYEDIGTTYRTFLNANSVYCIPEKLYYYRRNTNSIIGTMSDKALCDLYTMRKQRFEDVYRIYPHVAELGFKYYVLAALNLYDRSLWGNIDPAISSDALQFLSNNKDKILLLHNRRFTFFVKHPHLYRIYRLFKHKIGNLLKSLRLR